MGFPLSEIIPPNNSPPLEKPQDPADNNGRGNFLGSVHQECCVDATPGRINSAHLHIPLAQQRRMGASHWAIVRGWEWSGPLPGLHSEERGHYRRVYRLQPVTRGRGGWQVRDDGLVQVGMSRRAQSVASPQVLKQNLTSTADVESSVRRNAWMRALFFSTHRWR